jgi:uncharacterized membrane protein
MRAEEVLDLKRIQGLTDATFAVAMTLLILEIKTPVGLSPKQFHEYFYQYLLSDIVIYLIGFLTLGIFWIGSHYHHNILLKTDRASSWLNILFLMAICMIPYCISLIRHYKKDVLSLIFYCAVLIVASSINLIMITYAWKKKHTREHYTISHFNDARIRIFIPIVVYLLNIPLCILLPKVALWAFFIPFILHLIPEKYEKSM